MRTSHRSSAGFASSFSFALSICLSTALVGCVDQAPPATTESSSAATAAAPTYLVSFASGSVPSNAASILSTAAGSAGATIKATYANLGMVLVSTSSTSFVSALRADSRVDAVGPSRKLSSAINGVTGKTAINFKEAKPTARPKVFRAPGADPLSFRQWDMDQIHSPQARAINAGSSSVLVGILDSGIDITHPDLAGQVNTAASASCIGGVVDTTQAVWSNDIIGHGTHVAGNIAGKKNNVGIVGVAPGVKLAGVKLAVDDVNDPNFGLVFADAMVCAIDWAIQKNFDLMNASLTIDPFTGPIDDIFCTDDPDRDAVITMVRKAVVKAALKNISLVASTGNMFLDLASLKSPNGAKCDVLPVALPTVIGVSAVGYTKQLSWFSDYGAGQVDLAGPGGDNLIPDTQVPDTTASGQVLSSVPPGSLYYALAAGWNGQVQDCSTGTCSTYAYLQGTSQAAPHVTGVAALAISRFGKMGPVALRWVLSRTASGLACPASPYDPGMTGQPATCSSEKLFGGLINGTNFYGAGEVDAYNVLTK
ncbi:MAG TPA: S8 family serine peptidase [Polyangia bacterium]|nr:S8 family serine peptidase [Polyangia bacterium]